jgi:predicted ATPase
MRVSGIMGPMPTAPLFGRDAELAAIASVIAAIRERGSAMLVRGEPGVGKSALLRSADGVARAQGFQVLRASGEETESRLEFAGLHQLLLPVLDDAHRLPARQRNALEGTFGVAEPAEPSLFLIALAALGVLSEAADSLPVLISIDDAHWLDESTLQVLSFVARRLEAERIVMISTVRDEPATALMRTGLQELVLGPLDDSASEALLDAASPDMPIAIRRRVLDEAAGNPLLPAGCSSSRLASALTSRRRHRPLG